MPRLIDLGDVLAVINTSMLNLEYTDENRAMQKAISMLPTVDAVEVVRCKDCKWRIGLRCYHKRSSMDDLVGENDFCSWGERRKDADK